jgi:hypothetical protein
MIVRAPDALRLYGMTESGQRAFDVAWVSSGGADRVVRIYRAPFLKDDRILDKIARASADIFLRRVPVDELGHLSAVVSGREDRIEQGGVTFFYGGLGHHLRWFEGRDFAACFMDWRRTGISVAHPVYHAPRRIHYHSTEGPYPYDLTLKLLSVEPLEKAPPDSIFGPR